MAEKSVEGLQLVSHVLEDAHPDLLREVLYEALVRFMDRSPHLRLIRGFQPPATPDGASVSDFPSLCLTPTRSSARSRTARPRCRGRTCPPLAPLPL